MVHETGNMTWSHFIIIFSEFYCITYTVFHCSNNCAQNFLQIVVNYLHYHILLFTMCQHFSSNALFKCIFTVCQLSKFPYIPCIHSCIPFIFLLGFFIIIKLLYLTSYLNIVETCKIIISSLYMLQMFQQIVHLLIIFQS